ncbi:MAG: ABC transporter permease subunit [Bacteroidota bacterium]
MLGIFLLTLRELRAKWIVVGLFVVATLIWGTMALALQLDVVDGSLAGARLFGQQAELGLEQTLRDDEGNVVLDENGEAVTERAEPEFGGSLLEDFVIGSQIFVAGAAYWVGILLALFATGGLVASLQTRGEIDLLLSKPLSRSQILGGRLAGVGAVTLGLIVYLIGAVWLVMSLKTGIWNVRFLLAIPVIWSMFMVLYSIVTLMSVWTGSSALSLMVVLAVLFASLILAIPELDTQVSRTWRPLVIGLRHALPRFPNVGVQMVPQLATGDAVGALSAFASSIGIGVTLYALAFWRFARRDF